ncbi:serine hydrolase domain-containing protein [Terrarubrum flagellatum]|uniref:serine hydrolase domain-containing protein n=1 Tax=Terrirubrum flagellatum TaxID=2895980 RepID=UPI003144F710
MSGQDLRWSAAAEEAARIAEGWRDDEPGGAIALFDATRIRSETCGGLADLASGAKFSADTVSRYASITKHVFASMMLRQGDRIGLDDPLGRHLPNLREPLAGVTAGRALDMTGGLPDVRECLSLLGVGLATVSEKAAILDFVGDLDALNFPAGSEISYSNTGYRLLDAAMEAKGARFQTWLDETLNRPIGLHFVAPETWAEPVKGLAPGYWKSPEGWRLTTSGLHLSASGCLIGSVRDLGAWLQALMADRDPARGLLPQLSATRFLGDGRPTAYGLGLARTVIGGRELFGHGGSHAGYKAYFLIDSAAQAGVALVSNREDTLPFGMALRVMAALHGEKPPAPGCDLAEGLYAAETGPSWLEVKDGVASFLGSGETLYPAGDGSFVSLSAHFPVRLRQEGEAISGEISHVARQFIPVRSDERPPNQTDWSNKSFRASFAIEDDRFVMGIGPTRQSAPLTPLGKGRFIAETSDGPWPKRFCLAFEGDKVRLVTNRSRGLTFNRV